MADSMSNPRCVLLFSGKRKSGKDYIVENLLQRLKPNDAVVLRLSAPIKKYWAESKGLDFDQLLGTGAYKENYRLEMIRWGESVRARDPGYFCQRAIEMSNVYGDNPPEMKLHIRYKLCAGSVLKTGPSKDLSIMDIVWKSFIGTYIPLQSEKFRQLVFYVGMCPEAETSFIRSVNSIIVDKLLTTPAHVHSAKICHVQGTQFSVWIVSDTRRLSDLKWFLDNCGGPSVVHTVRVVADDAVRKQRGWMYTPGIDDAESECGLDSVTDWNWIISNNGKGTEEIEAILQNIVQWVNSATSVAR